MPAEMTGPTGALTLMGTFYPWWLLLLQGIVALLLGIALLAYPLRTLLVIIILLGAYWLVSRLFTLFGLAFGFAAIVGVFIARSAEKSA